LPVEDVEKAAHEQQHPAEPNFADPKRQTGSQKDDGANRGDDVGMYAALN